jgi:steroid 5-alpha reductase family enzyme
MSGDIFMKNNRKFCFLLIFLIYIGAIMVGVMTFCHLSHSSFLIRLLWSDIASTIFVYLMSLLFRNASVYDPYWSVAPLVVLPLSAFYYQGFHLGVFILLAAVFYWGIRLTLNWMGTFTDFNYQDWRYVMLKEKSKQWYPLVNFFGIHLFPTLIVYGAMVPAILFIEKGSFEPLMLIGFLVSVGATTLQMISDIQMHYFRKHNRIRGKTIDIGLWKYSRHPNYLGEILMWWGVYLMMLASLPSLWITLLGPLFNTLMFIFISIPMAEVKLLQSKSDYAIYQASTRMLLPIKRHR